MVQKTIAHFVQQKILDHQALAAFQKEKAESEAMIQKQQATLDKQMGNIKTQEEALKKLYAPLAPKW